MTVQEVAKTVMKYSGLTQKQVAERAGMANQSSIAILLQAKSMRVDSLLKILEACGGFELVVRATDGRGPEFIIGDNDTKPDDVEQHEGKQSESEEANEKLREVIRSVLREELGKENA